MCAPALSFNSKQLHVVTFRVCLCDTPCGSAASGARQHRCGRDPSHALDEADVERFGMLEAMLDSESVGHPMHVTDQLAARVLDDRAIAGMHAAAVDLGAAMRGPGSVAGTATPMRGAASPRGGLLDDDGAAAAVDFERGLQDSMEAYRRACELGRAELDGEGAHSPAGGQEATDGAGDDLSGDGSAEPLRDELYPMGRILHLAPASWLHDRADGEQRSGASTPGHRPAAGRQPSDRGATDAAVAREACSTPPASPGTCPVGGVAQQPPMHLPVDDVPHGAYSRISLCQTMLADHFLFRYIEALDSVIESFAAGVDA